jgi:hypothetical protein
VQKKRAFYEEEVLNGIEGHPFCIELYDSFFSPRGPYLNLVLHKAEEDLNGYLARKGHLPEPTARSVLTERFLSHDTLAVCCVKEYRPNGVSFVVV